MCPQMSRWVVVALLPTAATAAAPAWADPACEARMSPAQRERFVMAVRGCREAAVQRTAPADRHADALVASAGLPRMAEAEMPPRESAHLQLFGRSPVTTARIEDTAAPRLAAAPAPRRAAPRAVALAPEIDAVARRHDIDPLLLHAIAHVESRHDPAARSRAGARGLMQVMPGTAERFGVGRADALHDAPTNLEVSASYLKTLQQRFGNQLPLVLAAYNAGEGAVEKHGRRIPPYAETRSYVKQVIDQYRHLSATAKQRAVTTPVAHR